MKPAAVILFSGIVLLETCTVNQAEETSLTSNKTPQPKEAKIDFKKQVLPIMVKNCSPCHFTGGKMYERLPFDQDTTIINHGERILNRIKNDEENSLLKAFLHQNKN